VRGQALSGGSCVRPHLEAAFAPGRFRFIVYEPDVGSETILVDEELSAGIQKTNS
jgi:hypothetical protein